jgi:hypothetical protein
MFAALPPLLYKWYIAHLKQLRTYGRWRALHACHDRSPAARKMDLDRRRPLLPLSLKVERRRDDVDDAEARLLELPACCS